MATINVLDENLINKIAAGEVVERPASAIKELIENSIDADSDQITIEIAEAGDKLIRITDNGFGMDKEDAILCLERHATSKLKSIEDLHSVRSMGFRGEALASIAAVSKMKLTTKKRGESVGTEITVEGGIIRKLNLIGCPEGTVIEIRDLFFNTPARKKFMKSEQTEYQAILDIVTACALSWPNISFRLIKDQRPVFELPSVTDELTRIRGVFGKNTSDELIEIFYSAVNIKIAGYIGKPSVARSGKGMQYFFVNNRPIKSAVLGYAIKQAFGNLIPKEKYPIFIIRIDISPSMVDINIHPRKTEIKFSDEKEIFRVISASCKKSLEKNVLAPKFSSGQPINFYQDRRPSGIISASSENQRQSASEQNFAVPCENISAENSTFEFANDQSNQHHNEEVMGHIEVIGQHDNSFIICRSGKNLLIVDQHAAHERIRFEKLQSEHDNDEKSVQTLLAPVTVELTQIERAILDENKEHFDKVGIQLSHFGGNSFVIEAVPSFLIRADLEKILLGLIEDLKTEQKNSDYHKKHQRLLATLACRSAVKFGDVLSREEQIALIENLLKTPNRYSCPHGRPSMIVLEENELWSRFGRKYINIKDGDANLSGGC